MQWGGEGLRTLYPLNHDYGSLPMPEMRHVEEMFFPRSDQLDPIGRPIRKWYVLLFQLQPMAHVDRLPRPGSRRIGFSVLLYWQVQRKRLPTAVGA